MMSAKTILQTQLYPDGHVTAAASAATPTAMPVAAALVSQSLPVKATAASSLRDGRHSNLKLKCQTSGNSSSSSSHSDAISTSDVPPTHGKDSVALAPCNISGRIQITGSTGDKSYSSANLPAFHHSTPSVFFQQQGQQRQLEWLHMPAALQQQSLKHFQQQRQRRQQTKQQQQPDQPIIDSLSTPALSVAETLAKQQEAAASSLQLLQLLLMTAAKPPNMQTTLANIGKKIPAFNALSVLASAESPDNASIQTAFKTASAFSPACVFSSGNGPYPSCNGSSALPTQMMQRWPPAIAAPAFIPPFSPPYSASSAAQTNEAHACSIQASSANLGGVQTLTHVSDRLTHSQLDKTSPVTVTGPNKFSCQQHAEAAIGEDICSVADSKHQQKPVSSQACGVAPAADCVSTKSARSTSSCASRQLQDSTISDELAKDNANRSSTDKATGGEFIDSQSHSCPANFTSINVTNCDGLSSSLSFPASQRAISDASSHLLSADKTSGVVTADSYPVGISLKPPPLATEAATATGATKQKTEQANSEDTQINPSAAKPSAPLCIASQEDQHTLRQKQQEQQHISVRAFLEGMYDGPELPTGHPVASLAFGTSSEDEDEHFHQTVESNDENAAPATKKEMEGRTHRSGTPAGMGCGTLKRKKKRERKVSAGAADALWQPHFHPHNQEFRVRYRYKGSMRLKTLSCARFGREGARRLTVAFVQRWQCCGRKVAAKTHRSKLALTDLPLDIQLLPAYDRKRSSPSSTASTIIQSGGAGALRNYNGSFVASAAGAAAVVTGGPSRSIYSPEAFLAAQQTLSLLRMLPYRSPPLGTGAQTHFSSCAYNTPLAWHATARAREEVCLLQQPQEARTAEGTTYTCGTMLHSKGEEPSCPQRGSPANSSSSTADVYTCAVGNNNNNSAFSCSSGSTPCTSSNSTPRTGVNSNEENQAGSQRTAFQTLDQIDMKTFTDSWRAAKENNSPFDETLYKSVDKSGARLNGESTGQAVSILGTAAAENVAASSFAAPADGTTNHNSKVLKRFSNSPQSSNPNVVPLPDRGEQRSVAADAAAKSQLPLSLSEKIQTSNLHDLPNTSSTFAATNLPFLAAKDRSLAYRSIRSSNRSSDGCTQKVVNLDAQSCPPTFDNGSDAPGQVIWGHKSLDTHVPIVDVKSIFHPSSTEDTPYSQTDSPCVENTADYLQRTSLISTTSIPYVGSKSIPPAPSLRAWKTGSMCPPPAAHMTPENGLSHILQQNSITNNSAVGATSPGATNIGIGIFNDSEDLRWAINNEANRCSVPISWLQQAQQQQYEFESLHQSNGNLFLESCDTLQQHHRLRQEEHQGPEYPALMQRQMQPHQQDLSHFAADLVPLRQEMARNSLPNQTDTKGLARQSGIRSAANAASTPHFEIGGSTSVNQDCHQ